MKRILTLTIIYLFTFLFPLLMKAEHNRNTISLHKDSLNQAQPGTKTSGFVNRTELTISNPWAYGIRTINGYKINQHWSAGIGIGFFERPDQNSINYFFTFNYSTLPVFLDLKYDIPGHNHSTYFYADAGYSVLLSRTNLNAKDSTYSVYGMRSDVGIYTASLTGGFTGSCGIGYSLSVSPKTQWTVSLACDFTGVHEHDTETTTYYYYNWYPFSYVPPGPPIVFSNNAFWEIGFNVSLRTGFIF